MEISVQSFFKIILQSTIEDKKLRLPLRFVRSHGHELSDVAKLITVTGGKVWQVRVIKGRKNIWFDDGWHEFAKFYSLCHGHFLVFKYKGMSNFSIHIFNKTACEITYPCIDVRSDDRQEQPRSIHEDDDCFEILSPTASCPSTNKRKSHLSEQNVHRFCSGSDRPGINKRRMSVSFADHQNFEPEDKRKGKKSKVEVIDFLDEDESEQEREIVVGKNFHKLLLTSSPESQSAVAAARMYKPESPAFMCIIQQQNYIPSAFSSEYLNRIPEGQMMRFRISDEKQWQREWLVRPYRRKYGGLVFTEGWNCFFEQNDLNVGDVCVFELIDLKSVVLKVSIFHSTLE